MMGKMQSCCSLERGRANRHCLVVPSVLNHERMITVATVDLKHLQSSRGVVGSELLLAGDDKRLNIKIVLNDGSYNQDLDCRHDAMKGRRVGRDESRFQQCPSRIPAFTSLRRAGFSSRQRTVVVSNSSTEKIYSGQAGKSRMFAKKNEN